MAGREFALDYIDVATRIVEFRERHPKGSLQQVAIDFREVDGRWWVIYTAAAYRYPEDERPGIGTAWEPIPGRTPYTRDSEVQNAETAAWGRAIVAALAGDTKKGIASAEEVRNRRAEPTPQGPPPTFDELVLDVSQANSLDALAAVARRAVAAHQAGHIHDQQEAAVRKAYEARKSELQNGEAA